MKLGHKQPVCDNPEGVQGIMAYRNECHFMKVAGDNGNVATAPDIAEPSADSQGINNSSTSAYGAQNWLPTEHQLPILTPSSGMTFEKNGSISGPMSGFGDGSGDSQDTSGTPDGGQSNRPTPNSSSGSDQRMHLNPGQLNSGQNSFQASPISPNQTLMNPGSLDGSTQDFFADPSAFTMPTSLTDQSGAFALPNGWGDIQGQTGVTPVGEGVLRALMNMGPMDAMDLSSWDPNNNN